MPEPLLQVDHLSVDFVTAAGRAHALDDVSFTLAPGEILGVVGESGSGKSTLVQALMRILSAPGLITSGTARFEGKELFSLDDDGMRALRWKRMSMVFQNALDALNPVRRIGDHFIDTWRAHAPISTADAHAKAGKLLQLVSLDPKVLRDYPHQLSGGMRQRVCIALALAFEPSLLILDEPTTALDVLVEREIMKELVALQARLGVAMIFVSHDLRRVLELSHHVAVFLKGRLIEQGPSSTVRASPQHEYTRRLLDAGHIAITR